MRKFFVLFLLTVSYVVASSPIKSMLSVVATKSIDDSEQFDNPYITDDLIAMWDGEWNSGFGVHDDNSSIWKDLSFNGYDLIVNGGSFGDNYFDATGTNYASRVLGIEFESIEAVVIPIELNKHMKNIFISGYGGNYGRVIGGYSTGWSSTAFAIPSAKYEYDIMNGFPYCIYADNYGSYLNESILVNNEWIGNPKSSALDGYRPGNLTSIGWRKRDNSSTDYKGFGYILCIRLYSRKLTSQEIEHNHAIDKVRFNLP